MADGLHRRAHPRPTPRPAAPSAPTCDDEFAGVFGPETIERFLTDSLDQLLPQARITTFVPVLAERFARDRLRALAKIEGLITTVTTPSVLFLCVHNAGRSQMAAGWLQHLAGDRVQVYSGGSEPASEVNPAAIDAMAEVGIDITTEYPKPWTDEIVRAADVVVTMGCGDACPTLPRQALRGLGARRPRRPRRRRRPPDPRRDPPPRRDPHRQPPARTRLTPARLRAAGVDPVDDRVERRLTVEVSQQGVVAVGTRCSVLSSLPACSTSSMVAAGSAIRSPVPCIANSGTLDLVVAVAQARPEGRGGGEQLGGDASDVGVGRVGVDQRLHRRVPAGRVEAARGPSGPRSGPARSSRTSAAWAIAVDRV